MACNVVTYDGGYAGCPGGTLCDRCVKVGDHDCGPLGRVSHGLHYGECQGANHWYNHLTPAEMESINAQQFGNLKPEREVK